MPIRSGPVRNYDELYEQCLKVRWEDFLDPSKTFKIQAETKRSSLDHSKYASLRVKDAIVDWFKDKKKERPSVEKSHPELVFDLVVRKDQFILSLDLCGAPLHERNLRVISGDAPIKEQLADACLEWSQWKDVYESGGVFMDPCCGSGTFLLEAMRMSQDLPAQFNRQRFALFNWKAFNESLWSQAQEALYENRQKLKGVRFYGLDTSFKAIERSSKNLSRVSWQSHAKLTSVDLRQFSWRKFFKEHERGLILCNPPYGGRLKGIERGSLYDLYKNLGVLYKILPVGWRMGVISSDEKLLSRIGMPQKGKGKIQAFKVFNGKIPCTFLLSPAR